MGLHFVLSQAIDWFYWLNIEPLLHNLVPLFLFYLTDFFSFLRDRERYLRIYEKIEKLFTLKSRFFFYKLQYLTAKCPSLKWQQYNEILMQTLNDPVSYSKQISVFSVREEKCSAFVLRPRCDYD